MSRRRGCTLTCRAQRSRRQYSYWRRCGSVGCSARPTRTCRQLSKPRPPRRAGPLHAGSWAGPGCCGRAATTALRSRARAPSAERGSHRRGRGNKRVRGVDLYQQRLRGRTRGRNAPQQASRIRLSVIATTAADYHRVAARLNAPREVPRPAAPHRTSLPC